MWDLPRPGLEPVSPALAGRFSPTAPPGKPMFTLFLIKEARIYNGENTASSVSGAGKTGQLPVKE